MIGIVGVCASGKSTLINNLQHLGYSCRHIAQEHSYVQDMWQRLTNPDILIYLSVSYEKTLERRKLNWNRHEYQVQLDRLAHARDNCDHIIETDGLSPEEVLQVAQELISADLQKLE